MENETTKKAIRYFLTPQIIPRIREVFFSGFSYVAFFMAHIYRSARLLPAGHPYLSHSNMGKYGIRHVIAEAGNNLVISKKNIDQIIVFTVLLVGIVILLLQIGLLFLSLFIQTANAFAIPTTFAEFFLVPDATHDLAFVLLDRVFGIPGFFVDAGGGTTCVQQGIPCFDLGQSSRQMTPDLVIHNTGAPGDYLIVPQGNAGLGFPWSYHLALHDLFEAYSVGLLLIAVFIFIYFVAAVVAETAQSGTPFGRRFNHVWAPLRIVAAMGMLVPLTNGLNSAQYILLFAAKWGSGFATNGWIYFNNAAVNGTNTLLGNTASLVAITNAPTVNTLIEFGTVLSACNNAYRRMYAQRVDRDPVVIDAWLVNSEDVMLAPVRLGDTSYDQALQYFNYNDIVIRFGEFRNDDDYQSYDGRVIPYCGEIKIDINVPEPENSTSDPGAAYVQSAWYDFIDELWRDAGGSFCTTRRAFLNALGGIQNIGVIRNILANSPFGDVVNHWLACIGSDLADRYLPIENNPNTPLPVSQILEGIRVYYGNVAAQIATEGILRQRNSAEWTEQLTALGWGGAGIWYNKVAQLNGSLSSAIYTLPTVVKYPLIMEEARKKRATSDTDTPGSTRHQIFRGKDSPLVFGDAESTHMGRTMYIGQALWSDHYAEKKKGGNIGIDAVHAIFGTQGLFNMQGNADAGIHPLAQLAAIGRSLVDSAIRNLGFSAVAGLGGGVINLFGDHLVGKIAMVASGFLSQIALIAFAIGFVLFYVVPMLPFIYFFFAVGGWIKGLFEAMVGVPLWALAHIRIDGNGLPGDAALGGYHLILEVFLRPILIVFGLLASITIFSAQVQVLHEIWTLVTSNATGFSPELSKGFNPDQTGGLRFMRGAIDQLFFTIIYAVIVYLLGMSAFKLIDLVPNHILRWIGASVATFGDQSGDPAENLVRNTFAGAQQISSRLHGAMTGAGQGASEAGTALLSLGGK